jgi:hypothetical protein
MYDGNGFFDSGSETLHTQLLFYWTLELKGGIFLLNSALDINTPLSSRTDLISVWIYKRASRTSLLFFKQIYKV